MSVLKAPVMDLSYRWLCELLPGLPAAPEVGQRLTEVGLELEEVREFGHGLDDVRIVRVERVEPHPNRDKLQLVTVALAASEQTVVCGASNVPAPGGLVVLAPLGSYLPAIGLKLEPRKLGGIISEGMLCSEAELGLGDGNGGILVLSPGRFPAGTAFYDAFPTARDTIFTIGVTPNRPDALGHLGVARDLAAVLELEIHAPQVACPKTGTALQPLRVFNQAPSLCQRYGGRRIASVKLGPSPEWMRWRLTSLGVRPISNVVDVTNLVMLESGNPMHAFDAARVQGASLFIRRAADGEKLATLDGATRDLSCDDLVIADEATPLALAGIMGGESSEISDETTEVLLEAAYFEPTQIRRSARRLGLSSESSFRFERGVDPSRVEWCLDRAAQLLRDLAGGIPTSEVVLAEGDALATPRIRLRAQQLCSLLGLEIEFPQALAILERLGFATLESDETSALVQGAPHRPDVTLEADLIEEVLRIVGLDAVPSRMPRIRPQPPSRAIQIIQEARAAAVACGLSEAVTYSFVAPQDLARAHAPAASVTLKNPMSVERSVLTTSLLPGLLDCACRGERHGVHNQRLFTIASRFLAPSESTDDGPRPRAASDSERLPRERISLCALLQGERKAHLEKAQPLDVFDAKGVALEMVRALTGEEASVVALGHELPHLHPRGAARLQVGNTSVGCFGPLHPDVRDAFELTQLPLIIELDLEALEKLGKKQARFTPIPRLPAVTRDVAVETPPQLAARDLLAAMAESAGELCESVELFDRFSSESLGERTSLAFRLVYRDPKAATDPENAKTLTDKVVDRAHKQVLTALQKLGVTVRA